MSEAAGPSEPNRGDELIAALNNVEGITSSGEEMDTIFFHQTTGGADPMTSEGHGKAQVHDAVEPGTRE